MSVILKSDTTSDRWCVNVVAKKWTGNILYTGVTMFIVIARSKDEAIGKGYRYLEKKFPVASKWVHQSCDVLSVDAGVIDFDNIEEYQL